MTFKKCEDIANSEAETASHSPDEVPMVEITVPSTDNDVLCHHDMAVTEIEFMSRSRKYGAETNLRSWRRALTGFKPSGKDGYAFEGHALTPGARASLETGSLIVVFDSSWAKANWYARNYLRPVEQRASLFRVTGPDDLEELIFSTKKGWARDLLGYLATNRALCEEAGLLPDGRGRTAGFTAHGTNSLYRRRSMLD